MDPRLCGFLLLSACDFSHPLSIEDALEIRRAEMRREEAAEQARQAILAEQEAAKPKKKAQEGGLISQDGAGRRPRGFAGGALPLLSRMMNRYRSPRRRCVSIPRREAGLAPAAS